MDCARGQMINDAAVPQGDVGCSLIVRQHGDHDCAAARLAEIGGLARTERDKRGSPSRTAIEYGDIMTGPDEVGRHPCAHTAESNKSKFHKLISMWFDK